MITAVSDALHEAFATCCSLVVSKDSRRTPDLKLGCTKWKEVTELSLLHAAIALLQYFATICVKL